MSGQISGHGHVRCTDIRTAYCGPTRCCEDPLPCSGTLLRAARSQAVPGAARRGPVSDIPSLPTRATRPGAHRVERRRRHPTQRRACDRVQVRRRICGGRASTRRCWGGGTRHRGRRLAQPGRLLRRQALGVGGLARRRAAALAGERLAARAEADNAALRHYSAMPVEGREGERAQAAGRRGGGQRLAGFKRSV